MQDSVPVPSDIGILRFYESAFMGYMLDETRDIYEKAVEGVYTAALRKNIVADVIYADGIDKYKFLYIPFAQMINTENIEKIRKFVENGGTVVAEACTAHYMDKGYCAFHIPGGLCDVFGGEELYTDYVEGKAFDSITFDNNLKIKPVIYAETLKADKGREIARYGNGKCAAVMNSFGKGKAILIGTYPSLIENEEVVSEVFAYIFGKMEIKQNIKSSRSGVNARLHTHGGMNYLYVVNQKNEKTEAVITIDLKFGCFLNAVSVVSGKIYKVKDNNLEISFEGSGGDCIELGR
jgi:beta-galactosidase